MFRKKGSRPLSLSRSSDLWDIINHCQLIDLGFKGSKYTWLNKSYKQKHALIFERLDRFLANDDWIHLYLDAQVTHLPRTHSDHCPLLLSQTKEPKKSRKNLSLRKKVEVF